MKRFFLICFASCLALLVQVSDAGAGYFFFDMERAIAIVEDHVEDLQRQVAATNEELKGLIETSSEAKVLLALRKGLDESMKLWKIHSEVESSIAEKLSKHLDDPIGDRFLEDSKQVKSVPWELLKMNSKGSNEGKSESRIFHLPLKSVFKHTRRGSALVLTNSILSALLKNVLHAQLLGLREMKLLDQKRVDPRLYTTAISGYQVLVSTLWHAYQIFYLITEEAAAIEEVIAVYWSKTNEVHTHMADLVRLVPAEKAEDLKPVAVEGKGLSHNQKRRLKYRNKQKSTQSGSSLPAGAVVASDRKEELTQAIYPDGGEDCKTVSSTKDKSSTGSTAEGVAPPSESKKTQLQAFLRRVVSSETEIEASVGGSSSEAPPETVLYDVRLEGDLDTKQQMRRLAAIWENDRAKKHELKRLKALPDMRPTISTAGAVQPARAQKFKLESDNLRTFLTLFGKDQKSVSNMDVVKLFGEMVSQSTGYVSWSTGSSSLSAMLNGSPISFHMKHKPGKGTTEMDIGMVRSIGSRLTSRCGISLESLN